MLIISAFLDAIILTEHFSSILSRSFFFLRHFHARLTSLRYLPRFLSFLHFFFFPYAFLSSYRLLSVPFFRGTTRPFNRVALSLAQDPPVPSCSAIAPLFQFLRLSYSSLPLSVSAALSTLSPSLTLSNRLASYTP